MKRTFFSIFLIKLWQIEFGVCKELLISSLNSKVDRFQRKKIDNKGHHTHITRKLSKLINEIKTRADKSYKKNVPDC